MMQLKFTSTLPDLSALSNDENLRPAIHLINRWYSGDTSFTFTSSGSTGFPKKITLSKVFLTASALRTIDLFQIQSSDRLLLALNTSFMGGMMMVIRAIVAQCELVYISPQQLDTSSLSAISSIKLAALVPVQAAELIKSTTANPFSNIQHLLLGGGPIDDPLKKILIDLKSSCHFYHTYGMTETASHVAIQEITNKNKVYNALDGFEFSTDPRGCLVIHYLKKPLFDFITNDVVVLHSAHSFEWIGRIDWVVNSGGIKYSLEQAEECVSLFFHEQLMAKNFTSYKLPDQTWGEKWILILEGTISQDEWSALRNYCESKLGKYIYPKEIFVIKKIVYLPSGKVDRLSSFKASTRLLI